MRRMSNKPVDGWCPRHPWPPIWAREYPYSEPYYYHPTKPDDELRVLEDLKKNLEERLVYITNRINELIKLDKDKK